MGAIDVVKDVGRVLSPPLDDGDDKALYRWRLTLVAYNGFLGIVVALHIAWACGFLPGFSGFAQAGEIKDLQTTQLDDQIMTWQVRYCQAYTDNNREASIFAYSKVQALVRQYYAVTGTQYPVPECNKLRL